jgi:hypothetical protein
VIAVVFSQKGTDDILRSIIFIFRKIFPQKCNYEIYDKEFLIIVKAFEEWKSEFIKMFIEDPI